MSRQPRIGVHFVDFWRNDESEEFIRRLELFKLVDRIDGLELRPENPDFLIYSCFGLEYLRYSCPRILHAPENVRPTSGNVITRHIRLPDRRSQLPALSVPARRGVVRKAAASRDPERVMRDRRGFCSFVNSNERDPERIEFFDKLGQYRHVDSGGRVRNSVHGRVADRHEFARQRKFAIEFENSSYPGYPTVKLIDAMVADAAPVDWGDPLVGNDCNKRAFIDSSDFESFDDVVEHVKRPLQGVSERAILRGRTRA